MKVIEVYDAVKKYVSKDETSLVLNGFNMSVEKGTIYALIGSSGCGKTTLILCLVGLLQLDSGVVRIFGECLNSKHSLRIGYMPQETALTDELNIREIVWFFGTIYGLSSAEIKERLDFLTVLLQLPDGETLIKNCSGGQQRRVSFALAMVNEPELMILDEPTVGVDPLIRNMIWDHLKHLVETKNVTVVVTTHYIDEAKHSNTVGFMRNGVKIIEDSPQRTMQICDTENMNKT